MSTSILLLFPEYSSNTLRGDVAADSTAVGHSLLIMYSWWYLCCHANMMFRSMTLYSLPQTQFKLNIRVKCTCRFLTWHVYIPVFLPISDITFSQHNF